MARVDDLDFSVDPEDDDWTVIRFRATTVNYERLYSTAALNGISRTEALNHAMELYEAISSRGKPGSTISYPERDGTRKRMHFLGDSKKEKRTELIFMTGLLLAVLSGPFYLVTFWAYIPYIAGLAMMLAVFVGAP